MAVYDRFTVTLRGSTTIDGTGSPRFVTVWTTGPEHKPKDLSEVSKYADQSQNNYPLWVWTFKMPLIEFSLSAGGMEGHDHARYLQLLRVLDLPFRAITEVEGLDWIVGTDGITPFWTQLLAPGDMPVWCTTFEQSYDYKGNTSVILTLQRTLIGLII